MVYAFVQHARVRTNLIIFDKVYITYFDCFSSKYRVAHSKIKNSITNVFSSNADIFL